MGFMKANIVSTRSWVFISSSLALPKRSFSYTSRTQALIMRMPATSSCIMELMVSSCACRRVNSGLAFERHSAMHPAISSVAHSTMRPKVRLSWNMKNMLPKVSMVVRIMPRTNWDTKFCTCVMSLVTRVTSEPAP